MICEQFGGRYNTKYNDKMYKCILHARTIDRSLQFNTNISIMLNDSRLQWSNCANLLENYVSFDLYESEEIQHKKVGL